MTANPDMHARYLLRQAQWSRKHRAVDMLTRARDVIAAVAAYRAVPVLSVRRGGACVYPSERARYRADETRYAAFMERDWIMMMVVQLLRRHTTYDLREIATLLGEDNLRNVQHTIDHARRTCRNESRASFTMQCRDLSNMLAAQWGRPVRGKKVDLPAAPKSNGWVA